MDHTLRVGRTLEETIGRSREDVVHLVGHATRLGHKAHGARSVQSAGHNIVQRACCVAYSEGPCLHAVDG